MATPIDRARALFVCIRVCLLSNARLAKHDSRASQIFDGIGITSSILLFWLPPVNRHLTQNSRLAFQLQQNNE